MLVLHHFRDIIFYFVEDRCDYWGLGGCDYPYEMLAAGGCGGLLLNRALVIAISWHIDLVRILRPARLCLPPRALPPALSHVARTCESLRVRGTPEVAPDR